MPNRRAGLIAEDVPALVLPWDHGSHSRRGFGFGRHRRRATGLLVLQLDLDFLRGTFLPQLVERIYALG